MGTAISSQDLQWQAWPAATTGESYITKKDKPNAIEELSGAITRAPFTAGEPIREAKLIRANGAAGYMAAILPSGMRAVSTEISPETGAGGFILPNDRVDVILSRRPKDDSSKYVPPASSETILTNVRVLAIDQTVEEKNGQRVVVGKTATLEIAPRQAETLTQARQLGTLSLALRSLLDASKISDEDSERRNRHQHRPLWCQQQPMTLHRSRSMTKAKLIRTATSAALIVMALLGPSAPVTAADPAAGSPPPSRSYGDKAAQFIPLGVEQEHRGGPARRHQGRAGGRSEDRQCGRAHVAARLHHRRRGRTDQRLFLRRRGQAVDGLRHRGDARSQRHSRRAQAGAAGLRYRRRRHRRRHHADRLGRQSGRGAAGLSICARYRRGFAGDGATRSSTASRCAAATR